jgi:Protein of unknown function (DUF3108)
MLACAGLTIGLAQEPGARPPSAASSSSTSQPGDPLEPFSATYAIDWNGLTAGTATLTLTRINPQTYVYSSNDHANGIFRVAFPDPINEMSMFRLADGHVTPLAYREDNGERHADKDVSLNFDWAGRRVQGMAGPKSVDQPVEPGTQDPLSVQIELMHDLRMDQVPATFLLWDKTSADEYHYTREGTEVLDTPLGQLNTVIYRSDRPGYDRVMRLWLAPSLGYLPVQAERRRKGKVEFVLHIRELKRAS